MPGEMGLYAHVASNIKGIGDQSDKKNEHPHIIVDEASSFSMKAGDTEEVSVEDVSARSLNEMRDQAASDEEGYQRLDGSQRSSSALGVGHTEQADIVDTPQLTYAESEKMMRQRSGQVQARTPKHLTPNKGRMSDASQIAPPSMYQAGSAPRHNMLSPSSNVTPDLGRLAAVPSETVIPLDQSENIALDPEDTATHPKADQTLSQK